MINKLNKCNSYALTASLEDSDDEKVILKVEDEKLYVKIYNSSELDVELYYAVEDNKNYLYNNIFGTWIKAEVDSFGGVLDDYLVFKELEFSWFDNKADSLILNEDYNERLFDNTDDIDEVVLEIEGKSVLIYTP